VETVFVYKIRRRSGNRRYRNMGGPTKKLTQGRQEKVLVVRKRGLTGKLERAMVTIQWKALVFFEGRDLSRGLHVGVPGFRERKKRS